MAEFSTESVWSHLSDDLRRFIRRRVADDHAADDLLQDTFVRIHRSLPALEDSERLTAWVYTIARNAIHDHYRRQNATEPIPAEGIAEDDDPQGRFRSRASAWMQELIDQLPEPYRVAVTLSEIDGLTQQEVADRLGLSLSGAKSRVQRGRALLRDVLDQCCTFQRDHAGRLQGCDPLPNRTVCQDCGEE
jgi:RNA polymerase sigma-70 factor (ECF subfamily)